MPIYQVPISIDDPVNRAILSVSEDSLTGFWRRPFDEIARRTAIPLETVLERIRAMLEAGVIRRVRQTIISTNLAQGALVAWDVPRERLHEAFDFMYREDPFSGHVVIRTTDPTSPGARYRLWTTIKVPQGFSLERHCQLLAHKVGARAFCLMPPKVMFVLGVGHVRRQGLEPGAMAPHPADAVPVQMEELSELEWQVLDILKRELTPEEVRPDLWELRAKEAGIDLGTFYQVAESLARRNIVGRFSTFLEHYKPVADGSRVAPYNALFHWAVAPGQELEAGRQIGRFTVLTHCYWREAGPQFHNVNIMAVAHGQDKAWLLAHKDAIDSHLRSCGIQVLYTNIFWGGRSEIKPSEVSPRAYREWLQHMGGIHPNDMTSQS